MICNIIIFISLNRKAETHIHVVLILNIPLLDSGGTKYFYFHFFNAAQMF